jgi:hypothetical protein
MWKQFHLEFLKFKKKMLDKQNQTLVTTICVCINVIAPMGLFSQVDV